MRGLVRKEDGCLDAIEAIADRGTVLLSFFPSVSINEEREDLADDALGTVSIHHVPTERTEYCREVTFSSIVQFAGEHGFVKMNRAGTLWQRPR